MHNSLPMSPQGRREVTHEISRQSLPTDLKAIAPNGFTNCSSWLFPNRPSLARPRHSATISDFDMLSPRPRGMFYSFFRFIFSQVILYNLLLFRESAPGCPCNQ
jgi:hypothetical protein